MANETRERNEENGSVKRNPKNPNITNGVVITVYREETRRRVSEYLTNKTTPRGIGHDRRALLLAYSRKLRDEACKKVPLSETKTKLEFARARSIWWRSSLTKMCRNEEFASKERTPNAIPLLSKIKNTLKSLSCKEM